MESKWNNPLKNAVEAGSVDRARSAIITHIDDDSRNEKMMALEIADDVSKVLPGLYEEDNGRLAIPSIEDWDRTFWNRIKAALGLNFSRSKIELATQVATHLRSRGAVDFQAPAHRMPTTERGQRAEKVDSTSSSFKRGDECCRIRRGEMANKEELGKKSMWVPILITVGVLVAVCVAVCCLKKA